MFSDSEKKVVQQFFKAKQWPCPSSRCLDTVYASLWQQVCAWQQTSSPVLIGIAGSNGSGKSTLVEWLRLLFIAKGLHCVTVSIDDFYLPLETRIHLSNTVHPLLKTRSAGTIDVDLLKKTLQALLCLPDQGPVNLPCFDKSIDDRAPDNQWAVISEPVDVVLWEGFCLSAIAQSPADLLQPINRLEAEQDAQCIWRQYVNDQITAMQSCFDLIDYLVYVSVNSFSDVVKNRRRAENTLSHVCAQYAVMQEDALAEFLMHHERLYQIQQRHLPQVADYSLEALSLLD